MGRRARGAGTGQHLPAALPGDRSAYPQPLALIFPGRGRERDQRRGGVLVEQHEARGHLNSLPAARGGPEPEHPLDAGGCRQLGGHLPGTPQVGPGDRLWCGASISQAMPGIGGSSHPTRDMFPWSTIARCQPGRYSAATTRCSIVTRGTGALGAVTPGPIAWVMPRVSTHPSALSGPRVMIRLQGQGGSTSLRVPTTSSAFATRRDSAWLACRPAAPGTASDGLPGRPATLRLGRVPPRHVKHADAHQVDAVHASYLGDDHEHGTQVRQRMTVPGPPVYRRLSPIGETARRTRTLRRRRSFPARRPLAAGPRPRFRLARHHRPPVPPNRSVLTRPGS